MEESLVNFRLQAIEESLKNLIGKVELLREEVVELRTKARVWGTMAGVVSSFSLFFLKFVFRVKE